MKYINLFIKTLTVKTFCIKKMHVLPTTTKRTGGIFNNSEQSAGFWKHAKSLF